MRARALLAALAVASVVPVAATHASASTALCPTPGISGVSPVVATPGATVTISGTSFTAVGCSVSVQVGSMSIGTANVQNTSISFSAAAGDDGPVQVTLTDSAANSNPSNANLALYVAPSLTSLSTRTPVVGQPLTINGSGFDLHVPSGDEQLSAAYLNGDGSVCSSATASLVGDTAVHLSGPGRFCNGPVSLGISAPSDLGNASTTRASVAALRSAAIDVTASVNTLSGAPVVAGGTLEVTGTGLGPAGSVRVGGTPAATSSWSDTGTDVTVPDTAVTGATVSLTRAADGATLTAPGSLHVVARVDGVSPASVNPGGAVTITGGGFGSDAGSVSLGGVSLAVSSWAPTAVRVTVPAGATSGALTLAPVDTGAPGTHPSLTVVQQPQIAGVSAAQLQSVTAALSAPPPPVAPAHVGGAVPPLPVRPVADGPITLTVSSPATSGSAGGTVPFTATLLAYGKPVANAAVELSVVYEPGSDGTVTPESAVTDAQGVVHGVIHLSRTPGQMIVLAESGKASDELRIVGTAVLAADVHHAAAKGSGFPLGLLLLAALLVAAGIALRQVMALVGEDGTPATGWWRRLR